MSEEQHHDDDAEHESAIKTPKQLITVIAAAIVVPVIVIIMLTQFVTLDNKKSPGSEAYSASSVAARYVSRSSVLTFTFVIPDTIARRTMASGSPEAPCSDSATPVAPPTLLVAHAR